MADNIKQNSKREVGCGWSGGAERKRNERKTKDLLAESFIDKTSKVTERCPARNTFKDNVSWVIIFYLIHFKPGT